VRISYSRPQVAAMRKCAKRSNRIGPSTRTVRGRSDKGRLSAGSPRLVRAQTADGTFYGIQNVCTRRRALVRAATDPHMSSHEMRGLSQRSPQKAAMCTTPHPIARLRVWEMNPATCFRTTSTY
jgi:hypothetical protein